MTIDVSVQSPQFDYDKHVDFVTGKRRNRMTQSCLNCHTSKRMVSGASSGYMSISHKISSVTVNDLVDAAPSSA